jgi:hypothetical protein
VLATSSLGCYSSTPDLSQAYFKTNGTVPSNTGVSPISSSSTWDNYGSSSSLEFWSFEALLGGAIAAVLMWHKRSAFTAAAADVVSAVAQVIAS